MTWRGIALLMLAAWGFFSAPVPTRRVVLVWRRTFPRYEAIAALRNCIYACELPGVTRLTA